MTRNFAASRFTHLFARRPLGSARRVNDGQHWVGRPRDLQGPFDSGIPRAVMRRTVAGAEGHRYV